MRRKAIKEEWQVPLEYLDKERQRAREGKDSVSEETKEKELERDKREAKELGRIYDSLSTYEKKDLENQAKENLPRFWQQRLKRKQGLSEATRAALEQQKRRILQRWAEERQTRVRKE